MNTRDTLFASPPPDAAPLPAVALDAPTAAADRRPCLLLVDDEPANLHLLRHVLQADHRLLFARDGERALLLAREQRPDLVLLDMMMPGLSGLEVCRALKADPVTAPVPVLFVTALTDVEHEAEGLDAGAVDYLTKPVSAPVVRARVRTHLSLVAADELRRSRVELVHALSRAGEFKDNETGAHVMRMSCYAEVMALALGFSPDEAEDLRHAAAMHDVGKIGIPDAVLLKPGPLSEAEWEVMRRHPEMGASIIGDHPSRLLQMARRVALHHHERWDGTGYPHRLAGADIPLEARITAVADVFDALTSLRPYKLPWEVPQALALLREQAGLAFDPQLIPLFEQELPRILAIRARWPE